jgi:lysophospholipase L1-like esterase
LLAVYNDATLSQTAYTGTATIVLGAQGAASSIVNVIKVPFARLSTTVYDSNNDPPFAVTGVPAPNWEVTSTEFAIGKLLTGGAAQAARWQAKISFHYTGQKFGIYFRASSVTAAIYQIWVNGQPVSLTVGDTGALISTGKYHLECDFGSISTRLVEVAITPQTVSIGGIDTEPGASIRRAPVKPRFAVLGDSIAAGSTGVTLFYRWPERVAARFGMDSWHMSIGGSGYTTSAGVSDFITRVPDCVAANPDVLIVNGGHNDTGQSAATVQTAAETLFAALQAALPNTILMATGCHQTSEIITSAVSATDGAIKAACATANIPFRSMIDPCQLLATVSAWANATGYVIGDRVKSSNNVWVCHTAHTSSGSLDTTKFIAQSFITGTGKAGATTGRGNADLFIQSDGVHLTITGQQAYASWVNEWLDDVLRDYAVA